MPASVGYPCHSPRSSGLKEDGGVKYDQENPNGMLPNAASPQVEEDLSDAGMALYSCRPCRPDYGGASGRSISLVANHFRTVIPDKVIHHYSVAITPDNCPRNVNREVFNRMVKAYPTLFQGDFPTFDGKANMYTNQYMSRFVEQVELQVQLAGGKDDRVFSVFIQWSSQVNLGELSSAMQATALQFGTYRAKPPKSALRALDVVMRHLPSMRYTPLGRSFFQNPGRYGHNLGGGRESWFGLHQNMTPSNWGTMLVIDEAATPFHKAQPVINLLCEMMDIRDPSELNGRTLSDSHRQKLLKEIKGLKVEVTHTGAIKRRYRVTNISSCPTSLLSFSTKDDTGRAVEFTIPHYFWKRYNLNLRFPHLPSLIVGPEERNTFLPLEVCRIAEGQRCNKKLTDSQTSTMIKATAKSAPDRKKQILKLRASLAEDAFVKGYGIEVDTEMTQVPGRIIDPPSIQYGGQGKVETVPLGGVWDMRGKELYQAQGVERWALVSFVSSGTVPETTLRSFITQLSKISQEAGMYLSHKPCFVKYASQTNDVLEIVEYLEDSYPDIQLIVFILPGKTPIYAEIKRVGDVVSGLATQCVQAKNVNKISPQTLSNICLKINVKLGGINNVVVPTADSRLLCLERPVIFLGADIVHPPPNDKGAMRPSIAAVVGSMDRHGSRYTPVVRLQKTRQELIVDTTAMVKELLMSFYMANGQTKPERIIMYRAGVSDRELSSIFTYEFPALRRACLELEMEYKPAITYVTVQKRHHTRLFCEDASAQVGKSGNIPAGTTVDLGITVPTEFDFYLCSHAGIQGTSRPSYYRVLWDDTKFSSDQMQSLTYQLCHNYARCTRSVSIPAPAYYAHLAAFRARHHVTEDDYMMFGEQPGQLETDGKGEVGGEPLSKDSHPIAVHGKSDKVMYFA